MHDTNDFEAMPFGQINDYLQSFHMSQFPIPVETMLEEAVENHVPIISNNVASLLKSLILIHKPKNILEFGTAYGFSTFIMRQSALSDTHITTVELSFERQNKAKKLFKSLNYLDKNITFINKDFREDGFFEELHKEYPPFDFVFVDAAKGQYSGLLEKLSRVVTTTSILIFDNVLLNGWIVQKKYPNHRQKTMFTRMNNFIEEIKENPDYHASIIPFDDGVLILKRK